MNNLNKKIYKIDELELIQSRNYLILSRSGSGKWVLIKNLMKCLLWKFKYNWIVLYSKTSKYDDEYNFIDDENKFDGNLDVLINDILEYQKQNIGNKILFILDDVEISKKNDWLWNLFACSRHFNITIILSSQYVKSLVSSAIRSNFHLLFFNQLNFNNLQCVYEMVYINIDKKEFFKFIYSIKEKFTFIYYNNMGCPIEEAFKLCRWEIVNFKIKF